jgi:hypothetical protein
MVIHMITVVYTLQESNHFNNIDVGWSDRTHGRIRKAYRSFDRKPERTIPLVRFICRWKDTIKTEFEEILWQGLDWVCLAEDTEP